MTIWSFARVSNLVCLQWADDVAARHYGAWLLVKFIHSPTHSLTPTFERLYHAQLYARDRVEGVQNQMQPLCSWALLESEGTEVSQCHKWMILKDKGHEGKEREA